MGLELADRDIADLEESTEGWIVGLQMAALSLQGREDRTEFVRAFTGSHRFVLDYLIEEVLDRQPIDVQDFLLQTSFLDQMTAALCEAVTGRADSQSILKQLEQANLFIVPLDNRREWFRYHHLFGDLLRQRLSEAIGEAERSGLYQTASAWFEQHGLVDDDLRHLLKHKRTYFPARLTARQVAILRRRSALSALWQRTGKPLYRFVTRRLLGWSAVSQTGYGLMAIVAIGRSELALPALLFFLLAADVLVNYRLRVVPAPSDAA